VHPVVLGQTRLPQLLEKASPVPVLKVLMHRARRAELARQGLPLNACPEHENNRGKHPARRHGLASTSGLALVFAPWLPAAHRNQRLNLAPQVI